MSREVWVTGCGVVSAAGVGNDSLRDLLLHGRSGVRQHPGVCDFPVGRADTPGAGAAAHARHLDRSAALFVAAVEEAWRSAGLPAAPEAPERAMVIEGSSLGPMAELLSWEARRLAARESGMPRPSALVRFMTGAGGAAVAHAHGIRGAVLHVSAGSVSAMAAIGEACTKIAAGAADLAVSGGGECPLHPEIVSVFAAAGILACDDGAPAACRPFDARRTGTVLGEGAAALLLESDEHARRRGAVPRAVVKGSGLASEAYSFTAPDPEGTGVRSAVRQALGSIAPGDIGWIKTHGTGTRANDLAESRGLAAVFGAELPGVPLTSLKPALGHCLGASGAVETVAALLALEERVVPPTLNTEHLDPVLPACTVATRPLEPARDTVLLLAESFGGRCAALVMERAG
jgi:3-oxoacyl-[acyl-carrier-protein] synthase II